MVIEKKWKNWKKKKHQKYERGFQQARKKCKISIVYRENRIKLQQQWGPRRQIDFWPDDVHLTRRYVYVSIFMYIVRSFKESVSEISARTPKHTRVIANGVRRGDKIMSSRADFKHPRAGRR